MKQVCLDTSVMQNSSDLLRLVNYFESTLDCYKDCQFQSPCREECQKLFIDQMSEDRGVLKYLSIGDDKEEDKKDLATSGGVKHVPVYISLLMMLVLCF